VVTAHQPEALEIRLRGRETQLNHLKGALRSSKVIVVGGWAGIGKTTLGRALAQQLESTETPIWVDCKKGMGLESLINALANFFGAERQGFAYMLKENLVKSPDLAVAAFVRELDHGDNVLFMDDFHLVTDPHVLHDLVKALRLTAKQARTVILTREVDKLEEALASEHAQMTCSEELVLGDLDKPGSLELLQDRGLGDRAEGELGRLYERTAGHPKGLELCAGLLVGGMPIEEIEALPLFRRSGDDERSLRRVLEETEKRLSRDELRLLSRCSVFDEPFDAYAMAAVYRTEACADVAGKLQRRFLLSPRDGRYEVHPLVRGYFYHGLKDEAAFVHGLAGHYYLAQANGPGGETERLTLNLKAHRHFELAQDRRQLIDLFWSVFYGLDLAGRCEEASRICEVTRRASTVLKDREAEAHCLGSLGLVRADQGRVREAIHLHQQALTISREIGDRRGESADLGNLGSAYLRLGEVRKAIEYHEQALIISREIGDRRGEGADLGNLGLAYANLGEVQKAIGYYEQALIISRDIGDRGMEGNVLGNQGSAYLRLGEVQKAIEYHEQALIISREIGDRRGEGADLGNLGLAYANLGEVQKAIGYYEQALIISREIGDRRGEGHHLGNLGNAYAALGEVQKAIGYYEQALTISREIGDRQGEGNRLGNLGNAYAALGEVQKAIGYYEQALVISREIGDRLGEGADLGNLGSAYAALGEVQKAIGYYEQALTISREIGDRQGEGNRLGNLGNAYAALGEVQKAIGYYEQALVISREIGDRLGEGNHLGNLGNAYAALGEVQKAIGYYEQALTISREIGDRRGEGIHLGNLGNAYAALGEVGKVTEYYQQALEIAREIGDRRGEGTRLYNLGDELEKKEKYEWALACYLLAVEMGRVTDDPTVSSTEARIERLKQRLGQEEFARILESVEPNKARIVAEMLKSIAQTASEREREDE
jgi:tetratricopeptide (TPR) repeat protein